MTWTHSNKLFEETPEEYQGFVYLITELDTGKMYVGKKFFWKPKTLPVTKTRKRKLKLELNLIGKIIMVQIKKSNFE